MNAQIDKLVKSLLQKDSLDQCSLQELEQFASRHPYFGAAQLLLTKKMQVEKNEGYNEQLQKTYLFFHNPLWVQQLLGETGDAEIHRAERPKKEETAVAEERSFEPFEVKAAEGHTEEEVINVPVAEEIAGEQSLKQDDQTSNTEVQHDAVSATSREEAPVDQNDSAPSLPVVEVVNKPKSENSDAIPVTIAGPAPVKEELAFEPYHTVDYFASQGIKLRQEEQQSDKLGRQLKSFTDWLKTMKRIPAAEIASQPASVTEKKVEQMAEHSIEDREVVTEAMAEVWVKQGNTQKAIETYRKLSLLDPSKSAYFAGLIEALQK